MTRKLILMLFILISISNARDISCRMRALGSNLALLIPDYETDVFYNSIFLNNNLVGIYYNTREEAPIKINYIYKSFGFYGFYWPQYNSELYTEGFFDWSAHSSRDDRFKGVFLLKIKSIGITITPDISRVKNKWWDSTNREELNITQRFLWKSSVGFHLAGKFLMFIEPTVGFWAQSNRIQDAIYTLNKNIFIPSGRISILYRDIKENNQFLLGYFEVGGPTSIEDINELRFSPFTDLKNVDKKIKPFCNSFITNLGICRGFPMGTKSMIAIGCKENFSVAFSSHEPIYSNYIDSKFYRLNNFISLLIAMEYNINRFTIRSGTDVFHNYSIYEERVSLNKSQEVDSKLSYSFTFGLGWQPTDKIQVDLKHIGYSHNILGLDYWSIYLKYLL